jgi:glycosyltransferase involved in cell wall biosynthesis
MLTSRYFPTVGGAQIHVEKISSALNTPGNDVVIVAEKSPFHLKSREIINGIFVNRAPLRFLKYTLSFWYFLIGIFECLRFNPNIIHAHFAFPPGLISVILSKIFRKPCVITVHGIDILKDHEAQYGMRLIPSMEFILKFTLRNASLIIACSEFVRKELKKFGLPDERIKIIPNGMDDIERKMKLSREKKEEYRTKLNLPMNQKILFTPRRLVPKNGLHYLLRSMDLVINKRKDVTLIIAGTGPQLSELKKLKEELGLQLNVKFFGEVNADLLERLYIASDVIVLPSLIEAFGLVVLESMAYSKPIIAFDSGGPTELILENHNGIIVENRNIEQLSGAILNIIQNDSLFHEFQVNSQKNIKKYDWNKITKSLVQSYETLL